MAVAADERGRTRMRESISVSRPWGVGDWAMLFSAEGSEDECKPAQDGFRRRMRGTRVEMPRNRAQQVIHASLHRTVELLYG